MKRIIYAGASSAYGESQTLPKTEDLIPTPISPYAVTKLAGELYMQAFTRVYGLETVTLRYYNVFGPYQDPTSEYSGVLALFTRMMCAGEIATVYGDGGPSRDFTFIDSIVAANFLAYFAPAENVSGYVFNVATGKHYTLNKSIALLCRINGYKGKVLYQAARAGDIRHSLADNSRAEQAFGYRPSVTFEEGLERTVARYRQQAVVSS